jgi:hypothetical protein
MPQHRNLSRLAVLTLLLPLLTACSGLSPQATATPTPSHTPSPAPTASPTSEPTDAAASVQQSCTALEGEVLDQMERIEAQVVALRGLRPTIDVERVLLTPDELRQKVIDDFLADYTAEQVADDAKVLVLYGFLPPDFDLLDFYIELYSEQVAGYYDVEDKHMAVVCGSGFGGSERVTYAHEYNHALQDQVYDLQEGLGYTDKFCGLVSERCAALQALVEGDATLLGEQWFQTYATSADFEDLIQFADTFEAPVFNAAPRFMRENFLFPYVHGRVFIHHHYLEGGWASVDALYENPPTSTEQILHPDRFKHDPPILFEAPDLLDVFGEGWRELDRGVLGEWRTLLLLEEQLPSPQAELAAEGWGGDYYVAFHRDSNGQSALILLLQWDTIRDSHEFTTAFREYGNLRFGDALSSNAMMAQWRGPHGFAHFERQSNQTLFILAPDDELAQQLYQSIPLPASPK